MQRSNKLKEYIDGSELRVVNDYFKIRLSKELAKKYDKGVYDEMIKLFSGYINQIKQLSFTYPGNADPVYYVYLTPDENFAELSNFPHKGKLGGKPVLSCDLDSFNFAYCTAQSRWTNVTKRPSMAAEVNSLHEISHFIHQQFFPSRNKFIGEGFAEAIPLYTLDYEARFTEHREALSKLSDSKLFSAKELLGMEKNKIFWGEWLSPGTSCSFDTIYISSYLFIRGCLELAEKKYKLDRVGATQKLLEIIRVTSCQGAWLIEDIADALGESRDKLIFEKTIQLEVLERIIANS